MNVNINKGGIDMTEELIKTFLMLTQEDYESINKTLENISIRLSAIEQTQNWLSDRISEVKVTAENTKHNHIEILNDHFVKLQKLEEENEMLKRAIMQIIEKESDLK